MALTKIDDRGLKTPIDLLDDEKIRLGTGNDLELYHNGTHSYLDNGTGYTFLRSDSVSINGAGGSETMAAFIKDGACELWHDNVKRFETHSEGTYHYGHSTFIIGDEGESAQLFLHADDGDDNGDKWKIVASAGGPFYLQNYTSGSWESNLIAYGDGGVELYHNNLKRLQTETYGTRIFNDSGECRLEIQGSEGNAAYLQLNADDGDDYADYWRMYGSASASEFFIQNFAGGSWATNVKASGQGAVELYHNGAKKLETWAGGIKLNGVENAGSQLQIGANADLALEHDGSNTYIANSTGDLVLQNDANVKITAKAGGTQRFRFDTDGLKFGTDTAAANALDDYEEGTFTPTSSAVTLTGTIAGHYTKIGDLVTVQCIFVVPVTSNSSDIEINGLPFNAKNGTDGSFIQGGCVTYHNQGGGPYTVLLANNNNQLVVYKADGNRQTFNQFSNANLRMMATYKVA